MTEIIINPCEDDPNGPGEEGGNGGNGGGGNGGGDPTPPEVVLDRVSFPEKRIDTPIPLSERNVTIMNSVNFFEASSILVPNESLERTNWNIRLPDSTLANILEIDPVLIEEADFRQDDIIEVSPRKSHAISGFHAAQEKGLIHRSVNVFDYLSELQDEPTDEAGEQRQETLDRITMDSGMRIDQIRYLSGLVFVEDPETKILKVPNKQQNRWEYLLQFPDGGASNIASKNIERFGCPFVIVPTKDTGPERLLTPSEFEESTSASSLKVFGISAAKQASFDLRFGYNALNRVAGLYPSILDDFKGPEHRDKVKNFADFYALGGGKTGFYTDEQFSRKTNLTRAQARRSYLTPLITQNITYSDLIFEAPQAFFREEADLVALERQFMVDINVRIGSAQLNDGSTLKYFKDTTDDELKKKNFYRTYNKQELEPGLERRDICRLSQSKCVKFSSRNVDQFEQVDEKQRNLFSKYVNIVIENQKAPLAGISSILKQFDMDKYIIEMMADTNGLHRMDEIKKNSFASERLPLLLDHHYNSSATLTDVESYYSQYLQPGEQISDVRDRMQAVIENFNQTSVRRNIMQQTWTSFGDNLNMVKLVLNKQNDLRDQIIDPELDTPGLYGSVPEVIDSLEWPLGFHKPLPYEVTGIPEEENNIDPRPNDSWRFDELKFAICSAKLKEYLEPKGFRGMLDIYKGEKCFSEVIGYKIKKFEIVDGQPGDVPVQEIYLMGHGSNNSINYIDTQVIFEKKYKYEIFTINFVLGNIYAYSLNNPSANELELLMPRRIPRLRYTSITKPSWFIVEAPLFTRNITIVDKPPLAPQVNFLPYAGNSESIRFLLQSNYGSIKQKPIPILQSDLETIDRMYEAQEIDIATGKLEYANDSLSSHYQMIRLDYPPTEYKDFAQGKVITVEANSRTGIIQDDIEPNKDYYYIFRAEDPRGISNPGFVYKLRMVDYENGIYMDLKEYDMSKKEDQITIPFREFFQIQPNNLNVTLNFDQVDITDPEFIRTAPSNVGLGNAGDNQIWDRKFKIRIKSKSSSRKIDLIVKFTKDSAEIETENAQDVSGRQDDEQGACD